MVGVVGVQNSPCTGIQGGMIHLQRMRVLDRRVYGLRGVLCHPAEKAGTQYSYAGSRSAERAEASKSSQGHFNQEGYWQQGSADGSGRDQAGTHLTELEIQLESQINNLQVRLILLICTAPILLASLVTLLLLLRIAGRVLLPSL